METSAGNKPEVVPRPTGTATQRLLVVAAVPTTEQATIDRIRAEAGGERVEVLVVAPALTETPLEHAMGDVDDAIVSAQRRLDASVDALRRARLQARGRVGDADPALAIEDALREFGADKIVIVTEADDGARWLEGDLFERAKQRFEPPIVHIVTEGGSRVVEVEAAGAGTEPAPDDEVEGYSKNTPRFSSRDLIGIAVAVIGTLAAILIAASCDDGETIQRTTAEAGEGSSGSCVAAYIVAGITALINVAHVVGLVLFESAGYRGGWARFFSITSLVGTPVAVVATLLLAH
jgi:hypothetical protein